MTKDIKTKILELANKGVSIIQIKEHIPEASYSDIEKVCNEQWRGKLEQIIN